MKFQDQKGLHQLNRLAEGTARAEGGKAAKQQIGKSLTRPWAQ